jgi:hypothetical protein
MFMYKGVAGGSSLDDALMPPPPKKKGGRDPITNKSPWTKEVSRMCSQCVTNVYLMCSERDPITNKSPWTKEVSRMCSM